MLAGLFALTSALAFLFPRSGDDWAWGSQIGIERLESHFHNYNGRYGGDLAILALTRLPLLAPFILAATLTLTIFLILDLAGNRTVPGYLLTILIFLTMPVETWRQSVVWLSGYSNYALAGLFILIYLRSAKRDWSAAVRPRVGTGRILITFSFAFVAALFMEHVTLYLVAASGLSLVALRWRFGRFSALSVSWFIAFLLGAAFMLSNGAYRSAAGSGSGNNYQNVQTGTGRTALTKLIEKLADTISSQAVTHNFALNLVLVLLICLLLGRPGTRFGRPAKAVLLTLTGTFFAVTYALPFAELDLQLRLGVRALNGVAAAILLVILVSVALLVVKDGGRRAGLLVCCGSIVVLILPLLVVNPVGPRCFYPTYLIFLVLMNLLVKEAADGHDVAERVRVAPFLAVLVAGVFASYFMIYGVVHHAASTRIAQVRAQVAAGATAVTVEQLPFGEYVHFPDPSNELWSHRYKLFYDLPSDLKITLVPRR